MMKSLILLTVIALVSGQNFSKFENFFKGYIQYTGNVYKELLASHTGNFLVCPLSVETIMALVNAGANGATSQQIIRTLQLPDDKQAIQKFFKELSINLVSKKDYYLSNANKVYVKKDFKISDNFRKTAVNTFNAEVENIDFEQTSEAVFTMNDWVEEKTNNKIKNLLSDEDLDRDTRMVLINALYFHGEWATRFDIGRTFKKNFHLSNGKKTQVDMMEVTSEFNYFEGEDYKMLEIPYKGNNVSMTIILPNDENGLSSLENKITEFLTPPTYTKTKVHVHLPKFKMESKIKFKPILQKLGIKDAFEDNADFTGIEAAHEPLKISKVVQKTYIEVEEKGTTAAAATAGIIKLVRSGHLHLKPPKKFNANHPFVYYITSPAGILFIGRYVEG